MRFLYVRQSYLKGIYGFLLRSFLSAYLNCREMRIFSLSASKTMSCHQIYTQSIAWMRIVCELRKQFTWERVMEMVGIE